MAKHFFLQDNKWGKLKFQMEMVVESFNFSKDEGFEKLDFPVGRNFQWEKEHILVQIYFRLLGHVCRITSGGSWKFR